MPTFTSSGNSNVYKSSTVPAGNSNGDLFVDTDETDGRVYVNRSGTQVRIGPSSGLILFYGDASS